MGRDTGIADRLRRAGLKVVEIDGWQTRGSDSFSPQGGVDHHTAGSNNGNAPSLDICINGREGLSGPLCNTLQGFDGTQYVIAAGRANHAGEGGWKGLSGNSSVYGMERENDGYSDPRPGQHESAIVAWKAILGGISSSMLCGHKEWAPGRKPDFHHLDYNWFRSQVASGGPPVQIGKDQMFAIIRYPNGQCYRWNGINKCPIPNPTMLGGDQIMLSVLGMDATVWNVDPAWADTFPEVLDTRLYWNSVVTAQQVGVPQDHIA